MLPGGVTQTKLRTVRMCFIVLNLSGSSQKCWGEGKRGMHILFPSSLLTCFACRFWLLPHGIGKGELLSSIPSPHLFHSPSLSRNLASRIRLLLDRATLHYYYCGWHGNAWNACKVVFKPHPLPRLAHRWWTHVSGLIWFYSGLWTLYLSSYHFDVFNQRFLQTVILL
jgi:hypothetical protein